MTKDTERAALVTISVVCGESEYIGTECIPAHPVAERCARFAELYRDEHAIGKSAEETCNEIAEACRSYAAPPAAEQDAEKDAALVDAYQKVLSAVSTSRTIYEAEAYLQNLLDAAILAAKEKKS